MFFFFIFFSLLRADVDPRGKICDVFPSSIYGYSTVQFSNSKICGSSSVYSDATNTLESVKCYTDTNCSSNVTCNINPYNAQTYTPEFWDSNSSYSLDEDCNYPNECNFTHTNYASNTNNFNNNTPSTLIFEANEPCPYDSNQKCMTFSDITLQNKNFILKFYPGDYYFNSLQIKKDTKIVLQADGNVRIFVKNDFKIMGDINKGGDSHNLFIYSEESIKVDRPAEVRAYLYAKGEFRVNQQITLYGALTAEGNINGNNGTFIYEGGVGDLFNCYITLPEERVSGLFDAWDKFRDINDRNISTKIVNKEFNLTIASINKDNNATEKKPGIDVKYVLVSNEDNSIISGWRDFNATNNKTITASYTINKADKNVSVIFKVCADYNGSDYSLKPLSKCTQDCNFNKEITEDNPCYRYFKSSDNFAVRPNHFNIIYSNNTLKAGKFNLIIKAVDALSNNVDNYNEILSVEGDSPRLDYSDTKVSIGCGQGNLNIISNAVFSNSEANVTLKYTEVGDLNITVKEINGSEFAEIDEDDTNDSARLITEDSKVFHFIPHHFEINATYNDFNNGSFTYVSSDLNMSTLLDINITAENEENHTTFNYNKNCYAKNFDFNVSYDDLNASKVPAIFYEINSTKYNTTTNNDLNFTNFSKNFFDTDNNGTAKVTVKINFDKNYTNPVEEFNMTVRDINVSDINGTFGSKDINDFATFRYGRIKISNVASYNNEINTTFEYQYWTDEGWVVNKEHNNTNEGNVTITSPLYAPNPSDITMNIIQQSGNDILEGKEKIKISTSHSLPYSAKIHLKIDPWLWYHPLAKDYKAPDSNNTDCLTHPCMKVDFLTSGAGWGGVKAINNPKFNEENRTSDINITHTDVNVSKSQVKKINW